MRAVVKMLCGVGIGMLSNAYAALPPFEDKSDSAFEKAILKKEQENNCEEYGLQLSEQAFLSMEVSKIFSKLDAILNGLCELSEEGQVKCACVDHKKAQRHCYVSLRALVNSSGELQEKLRNASAKMRLKLKSLPRPESPVR